MRNDTSTTTNRPIDGRNVTTYRDRHGIDRQAVQVPLATVEAILGRRYEGIPDNPAIKTALAADPAWAAWVEGAPCYWTFNPAVIGFMGPAVQGGAA